MNDKPKFVYVTYIASTPQKIFDALMNSEATKSYWGNHRNVSDWKPGSRWEHRNDDLSRVDIAGEVIENDPPHKLVVTWANPEDFGNAAKTSRVTYTLEPFDDIVRLTVIHDELEPDSKMLQGITFGWPLVLSSLKSYLERGQAIDFASVKRAKQPAAS